MASMRVLIPLALLVVITLAEYPSSNKTIFLDNEIIQYEENGASPEENKTSGNFETFIDEEDSSYAKEETVVYRLPSMITPLHYDIHLEINLTKFQENYYKYKGTVTINLEVTTDTNKIMLHCDKSFLELGTPTLKNETKIFNVTISNINNNNIVTLNVEKILTSNNYTLTLPYIGTVSDKNRGFYRGSYLGEDGKTRWYVATHFESISARSAFPCFDEPALKATFKLSITYDKGYTAISNTIGETKEVKNNQQMTSFKTTPKMSTYLIAYAITADFKSYNKSNIMVYSRPKPTADNMTEYAAEISEKVLTQLEKYTDIKYSSMMEKMEQIALPLLAPGAMENWGLVTYRETAILYNENVNGTFDKQRVANIIAHEFTHQWFGNLVTPEWWNYIWLNEGFATYFEYFIIDKIYPDWRYMDQFNVLSLQTKAFHYDGDGEKTRSMNSYEKSENEINDLFDDIAYDKAAAVIRMFSHVIGEDKFQNGLREYLKTNHYNTVNPKTLFKSLNDAADKKNFIDIDLVSFFEHWANQSGYPVITVTKNRKGNETSITVEQTPFYLVKPTEENLSKNKTWYIPLNYVQQTEHKNFNDTSVKSWLKLNESSISIKDNIQENGWIIFNVQQTGYYRVNYDMETWSDIIKYLGTDDFMDIHSLNRAQLIDDAFHLAYADLLNISVSLDLIKNLEKETDYIVWKSAFKILSKLNNILDRTEYYSYFLNFIRPITQKLFINLKLFENKNETHLESLLKIDAAKWACDIGLEFLENYSIQQFNLWLNKAENAAIPRDLKKVIFCAALRKANETVWINTLNKYILSKDVEEKTLILSSLGCSSSPNILKNFLDITVQEDSNFIKQLPEVFRTIYSNSPVGLEIVLDFLSENIDKLQKYDGNFNNNIVNIFTELANRIAINKDMGTLNEINFQLVKIIGLEDKLNQGVEIANRNNLFFKKHDENIQKWLGYLTENQTVTTSKPNSANSFSFSIALMTVSLLLVKLHSTLKGDFPGIYSNRFTFKNMTKVKALLALILLLARNSRTLPPEDESSEEDGNMDEELPEASYRLSNNVIPIHYDIKLIPYLDEDNFTFDGETNVRFNLQKVTQTLDFHAKELTFDETDTYVEGEDGQKYKPIVFTYVNATEIMKISFEKFMQKGLYTFHVKFTGILNDELSGFYRSSYTNDNGERVWLATTQFQATSARRAFPCWDEPSLKATFNVSIKHQTNYTALSNMPIYEQSMIDENDGKVWTHFQKTPIMSTYILAFVVSDFVKISNTDGTINVWSRKDAIPLINFGYEVIQKAVVLLEEYTNSSVRVPKMDHVLIPNFLHGAMENWGLVTYLEDNFLYNPNKNSLKEKTWTAMVVSHELTHQWFGNVVSPTWWDHVWLNEGFASFFQYYITDKIFPHWKLMQSFASSMQQHSFSIDVHPNDKPIGRNVSKPKDIEDLFSSVQYMKTPSLLRMLLHVVTDEVFHTSLIKYLQKYQYSNALPDDLWYQIQNGVDETPEISRGKFRVKEMMDTWIYQSSYPLVTVDRNYITGEVMITQEIIKHHVSTNNVTSTDKNDISKRNKWWIPINYATRTNTNFSSTLPVYWLNPTNDSITINGIDTDDWILLNVQQTGHYRVNYDDANWIKLANYLNSPDYEKIHVINRAQIIQDSYNMFIMKKINLTIFLELSNYLSHEVDYIVWCPIFDIFIRYVGSLLEITECSELIQPYILNLMNKVIDSVGFDINPDDDYITQLTKIDIRKWACHFDHIGCIIKANAELIAHLESSNESDYPLYLKEWVYCYGMNNANESTWNKLLDIYMNDTMSIGRSLACIKNMTLIEKYLNMTIAENSSFTSENLCDIFISVFYKGSYITDLMTDFVIKHWDVLNSRSDLQTLSKFMILTATSKNKLQEVKSFLEKKERILKEENMTKLIKKREQTLTTYEQILDEFRAWRKSKENIN
ncbi:uncharacterized protein LOC118451536 [Vespa mandarinia]|uniref:uncharacterized protein LOC118451536 n=1 Tax=Vespa mandarinia TaxID=7446 RepID=UPI00160843BE|nr:uncharacterized protein LOC118451536 [Vespa mandarinia]